VNPSVHCEKGTFGQEVSGLILPNNEGGVCMRMIRVWWN
jgi:hypothetical protein